MIGYKNLSDDELRDLLKSDFIQDYEKMVIIEELLDRGSIVLDRVETIH